MSFTNKKWVRFCCPQPMTCSPKAYWIFSGPPGSRLVYLGEVRKLETDRFEVGVRELLGRGQCGSSPLTITADSSC